jgi:alkanesulfonate monooxygenase SsuD/methylene tetrahydromethanopterin reductase-like flavin-dependent oxidoreductase (luciferase family)
VKGCEQGGYKADPTDWRVCKSIFVADDDATARRYARDRNGAYGFYYWNLLTKRRSRGQADIYKHDLQMPDAAVTVEYLLDRLVLCGSVNSVVDQLLYAGHDWVDPKLARRSMELMAEKVMPAVNAALGSASRAA